MTVTTFLTDTASTLNIPQYLVDGYIGLAPCATNMKDYSLSYQLLKDTDGQLRSLDWMVDNHFYNSKEPEGYNGMIMINEMSNTKDITEMFIVP